MENGYTRISNEILEALAKVNIGLGNAQMIYAILRKTYGWHKKADQISISQLSEATGMSKRNTIYCLQNLEAKKMLTIKRQKGRGNINIINTIGFNKNHQEWVVQEKSSQYHNLLQKRKLYYQNKEKGVVQEEEGSARTRKVVVQETVNGSARKPKKEAIVCTYKRKKETTKETITKEKDFPFLTDKDFSHTYQDYLQMRKEKKRPATARAEELVLKKLHEYDLLTAVAMLEQSILNSWTGVFPLEKGVLPKMRKL